MKVLRHLFYTLIALACLQIAYYFPQMPAVVASHFDGQGAPNGWSGRAGFFGLYAAILLMLVGIFIYLPAWSEKRASFGLKLPHREHWLSAQHIEQTRAFFRRQMLIIGIAHLLLAIYSMQLVILANFEQVQRLDQSIAWALGLYFLFLLTWLIHFYRHFQRR